MVAFNHPGQGAALDGLADGDPDIEKVMDQINEQWEGGPPSDFDDCPCLNRVFLGLSFRLDPNGVLKPVGEPCVNSQRFDQEVSALEQCDDRLVGIALEMVTGFVDEAAKGAVVAGIVTVAGAKESSPPLEWGIKRLLKAMEAKLTQMLEQHGDLFADAGVSPPLGPIATPKAILQQLKEQRAEDHPVNPSRCH